MTSLDPLFRLLVRTLAEQTPPRVHQPIAINELMDSVLPYRLVRRELGVDSAEDYETLLLRLCAGEGDLVQADPAAQAALQAELKKPLPDLAFLRVYGDTHVVLRTDPLMDAMEARPEERYAPPGEEPPEVKEEEEGEALELALDLAPDAVAEREMEAEDEESTGDTWEADPVIELRPGPAVDADPELSAPPAEGGKAPVRCPFCGGLLPPRMMINFCPHCGMGQDVGTCRTCGADMDVGWRYCVSCGDDAQGGMS